MQPYEWLYLCSNPTRLELTLRCLPKRPFQGLSTMRVCYASHLDPPDRFEVLHRVLRTHAPSWLHADVADLSVLERVLPPELHAYWRVDKKRWSLGMKLVLPYAATGPYLYTDDDVIVGCDPIELIQQGSFGSKGCFRFNGNKTHVAAQLFDALELPTIERAAWSAYDLHALDAGVWFDAAGDLNDWATALTRFAQCEYIQGLTDRNLELRCLDQRFLTVFGMKHHWRAQTIGNGFAPPARIRPGFFDRKPFFHYKSQSKMTWMARIDAYLEERV